MDDAALSALLQAQEELLLTSNVRRDADRLLSFLTEDVVEFGSSGRVLDREGLVGLLAMEDLRADPTQHLLDVALVRLGPGAALLTYRLERDGRVSLRSSVWVECDGRWRMRFHQGTRVGEAAAIG